MAWVVNAVNQHAVTSAPYIVVIATIFPTLSFIAICLRVYVRVIMIKAMGKGVNPV